MRYAFGFDPSINDSAWAVVGDDGSVQCGLIRNSFDGDDNWKKCGHMIDQIQGELGAIIPALPEIDVWVCEGQYTTFGKGSQDSSVRLGWISATAYSLSQPKANACSLPERTIAVPTTWTRGKPKEYRHPLVRQQVVDESEWKWHGKKASSGLMHNILDAIGLALWGLNKGK